MALRGRRSGMAVLDGLGGPSYKTSVCDRVQYRSRHCLLGIQVLLEADEHLSDIGHVSQHRHGIGHGMRTPAYG